jgi:hypothetical protein
MKLVSSLVAIVSLFLAIAVLPVVGGVLFALFLFFPLFLIALVAVLAGLDDRTVRQHDPAMRTTEWREYRPIR